MTNFLLIILIIAVAGGVFLLYKKFSDNSQNVQEMANLKADINQKDRKNGEIEQELKNTTGQKDEFAGKNKQLFAQLTELKANHENTLVSERALNVKLSQFRESEQRRKKEQEDNIKKLETSRVALENEKKRIIREDEERRTSEIADRDRMWNEHENSVLSLLQELCKKPEYSFAYFDNNNLPSDFDGSLKPDFMIDFLDKYIIFDSKSSKSDNLQNYINTQVKSTATKIGNNKKIYSMVFFVVPNKAISELNKTYFYEGGYKFFVISPESLGAIFASLKKITEYEFAEQMNPEDRDNIINLIADFDFHINLRNAFDILLAQSGVNILKNKENLSADIKKDVDEKKDKMRLKNFTPTELKTLMLEAKVQQGSVDKFLEPKALIEEESVQKAKLFLEE